MWPPDHDSDVTSTDKSVVYVDAKVRINVTVNTRRNPSFSFTSLTPPIKCLANTYIHTHHTLNGHCTHP